jgi:hypothetical protein
MRGRPKKYTKKVLMELCEKLNKYIDDEDIPILAEFAYQNNVHRQRLYEYPELADTIKRCIEKKEANLEKFGLTGEINTTMAIFSLKQLGWNDGRSINIINNSEKTIDSKSLVQEWMYANTIAEKDVNTDGSI